MAVIAETFSHSNVGG